jgi:hypothetical protein
MDLGPPDGPLRRHLRGLVRVWLGVPAGAEVEPAELPEPLTRRLLRMEEREEAHRDLWGNWEFGACEAYREGRLWVPEIDRWLREEEKRLAGSVALEPRWPGGRPFAVCLTHDVDLVSAALTMRQAARLVRARGTALPGEAGGGPAGRAVRIAGATVAAAQRGLRRAPDAGPVLERCAVVELEHGVRGSYFIPVHAGRAASPYDACVYGLDDPCTWRGRRRTVAEVLCELAAEGFDIGLHGSYRSATDGAVLREERERLEAALGRPVRTTRQHWLHWEVDRTPALQEAAGLRADTTLGFNRNAGFRAGTSLPFRWFDPAAGRALDLLQVPLVVQDAALTEPNALELGLRGALGTWSLLLETVRDAGGVLTLLVHPHALANPIIDAVYRRAVSDAVEAGAWVAHLAAIDAHWREREARLGVA